MAKYENIGKLFKEKGGSDKLKNMLVIYFEKALTLAYYYNNQDFVTAAQKCIKKFKNLKFEFSDADIEEFVGTPVHWTMKVINFPQVAQTTLDVAASAIKGVAIAIAIVATLIATGVAKIFSSKGFEDLFRDMGEQIAQVCVVFPNMLAKGMPAVAHPKEPCKLEQKIEYRKKESLDLSLKHNLLFTPSASTCGMGETKEIQAAIEKTKAFVESIENAQQALDSSRSFTAREGEQTVESTLSKPTL